MGHPFPGDPLFLPDMKHCHYESFTWLTGRGMWLVPYYLGEATYYPFKFEMVRAHHVKNHRISRNFTKAAKLG